MAAPYLHRLFVTKFSGNFFGISPSPILARAADGEAEAEDVRGLRPQGAQPRTGVGGEGAVVRGLQGGEGGGVPS